MKPFLTTTLLFFAITSFAQQVENVVATQQGTTVLVTYDIKDQPNRPYFVKLLMSKNGGQSFGKELKFVTGDVRNTKAGTNKSISWDAARELSYYDGNAIFRVEATPKTTALPEPVENQTGKVELTSVKGVGSRVIVDFIFTPSKDRNYLINFIYSFAFDSSGNKKELDSGKFGDVVARGILGDKDLLAGIPIKAQVVFNSSTPNDTVLPLLQLYIGATFEFRNVPIAR